MKWSHYQEAVFASANDQGDVAVESVAGSGKSKTGIELALRFNRAEQGLFSSFTKLIVGELDEKIREKRLTNVRARNYNSFGNGLIFKYIRTPPKLLTDYNGQKTDTCFKEVVGPEEKDYWKCRGSMIKAVAILKNLCILSVEEAAQRLPQIMDYYDIEVPDCDQFMDWVVITYGASLTRTDVIDYDDQKLLPILKGWPVPQVDFLIIDEYQDTSPLETRLMLSACKGGKVYAFGDRDQAIYNFKGTTPDSMQEFMDNRQAKCLPLSICYRCPISVVKEAQKIVPRIEWAPGAKEGVVDTIKRDQFLKMVRQSDMVLARTTADLVKSVLGFLEEGRGAYVEGQEYGTQLKYFLSKFEEEDAVALKQAVWAYFSREHPIMIAQDREAAAIALEGKVDTINALLTGCLTRDDLLKKIEKTFTNKGNGIRHMTAHKSKGLEGSPDGNVFILRPDRFPHPRATKPHLKEEEQRLLYVARTRTKCGLYYVEKERYER